MMKKFIFVLVLALCLTPIISAAVTVKMDDGTEISIDSLNDTEKSNMINYIKKINDAAASTATSTATEAIIESAKDPVKLEQWRKLITGTIKDIANDLNVTVNEFVKTPVGLGVAALIFYKVAGKDIFGTFMDVILAIPMWFSIMICWALVTRYFFGHKTEYVEVEKKVDHIQSDDTRKETKKHMKNDEVVKLRIPKRISRYNWTSSDARTTLGAFLICIPIILTFVCIMIIFV